MATGHMLTNKGKQYLMQGKFEPTSGTTIMAALIQGTQNTAADTIIEVADLDFLSQVFANGSTECTATNYARKTLTRTAATENDASDYSALDAADIVWSALGGATNNTLIGLAWYDNAGGTDASKILVGIDWFATPIATNGGDLTYGIADLVRAA